MTIRKSILALTIAASTLYATQASAFMDERPPPNGLNGPSLTGMTVPARSASQGDDTAMPEAVILPDGTRAAIK